MGSKPSIGVTLENRLMGQGIYVTELDRSGADIVLEYETVVPESGVTANEISSVVRTVLEIADEREPWSPGMLRATATTTDGTVRGHWHVEDAWFDNLYDDLSEVEFSELVLESVRPPTDDP